MCKRIKLPYDRLIVCKSMDATFDQTTFDNGLTVVSEATPEAHTGAIGFFVRAGTRDEDKAMMGVSHFLEHMMFKGTGRRSADDVNREFDEIGANYNAFTSQEMTVYWAHVLPEFMPRAVDLLGDMMRPALREDDFAMEKKVILEEIGMYEDRPHWRLYDALLELHFQGHPLSYRILGTNESIGALPAQDMKQYFDQRYGPDNMTVALAGRFDLDNVLADVDRLTARWESTGATRSYEMPELADRSRSESDGNLNRHYVAMICPGPSAQDESRYAAAILSDVLGDADGSRLYWALIDPGLADEADFSAWPLDRMGAFYAFASCDPDRAEQVEGILLGTIDRFADSIDAEEIERSKNKLATSATVSGEAPSGRMRSLGGQWTYLNQYVPLNEEIERLMAVTVQDVRDLLGNAPFQPRTTMRLGPGV